MRYIESYGTAEKICPTCHVPIKGVPATCWKCGKIPVRSLWRRMIDAIDTLVSAVSGGRSKGGMISVKADEEVISELISWLNDQDGDVRKAAALSLAKIAQKDPDVVKGAIPKLISLLEDENVHIRGYAARTLGLVKAEDAIAPLKKLLNDLHAESDIIVTPKFGYSVRTLTVQEIAREAIERIEKK